MLESRIIAAQSDDKYIERMRFEGEMLSDVDIARIEFESVQFIEFYRMPVQQMRFFKSQLLQFGI